MIWQDVLLLLFNLFIFLVHEAEIDTLALPAKNSSLTTYFTL